MESFQGSDSSKHYVNLLLVNAEEMKYAAVAMCISSNFSRDLARNNSILMLCYVLFCYTMNIFCDVRYYCMLYSDIYLLKPSAHSRLLSLLETIFDALLRETSSEALLRETFLLGCVGVIFQANSLFFYCLSKSRGPRFLSRNTAHSRFLSLVSCDQKQISNMLDLKAQYLAIKIVSPKLPHTADFLD